MLQGRGIGQIKRSALRKALQGSFTAGIIGMLEHERETSEHEGLYGAAWRWMLTLACLRNIGIDEGVSASDIGKLAVEHGIHGDHRINSPHQELFSIPEMVSFSEDALLAGHRELSPSSILSRIASKHRASIADPWAHILSEDIGSCFEVVAEARPALVDGVVDLAHKSNRRDSGVHHTPFDVTERMVDISFEKKGVSDNGVPTPFVICDLAVGAGAFLIQATRILANMFHGSKSTEEILDEHIIGFDIDEDSIRVAHLCLHLEAGCPNTSPTYNLYQIDSIGEQQSREFIQGKIKLMSPESRGVSDVTIGNPPYVQYKQDVRGKFQQMGYSTARTNNLSAIFLEQALEITEIGGVVCQILPISIVQSAKMEAARSLLISRSSEISIEAFDCVPGYIFDQGKIGSNSNRSITRQVAIVSSVRGGSDEEMIMNISRMVRWASSERDELFGSVETVDLPADCRRGNRFPMLGDSEAVRNYRHLLGLDRTISNFYGSGKPRLFITKAVRYFITGVPTSLGRQNEIELRFDDVFSRDLVMVVINSSFFYWYWKVVGNGFQVNLSEISSLRIPDPDSLSAELRNDVTRMATRLARNRGRLSVEKSNKGIIRNVKYDLDKRLMTDLNELLDAVYQFPCRGYPFYAAKSNNLRDYSLLMQQH